MDPQLFYITILLITGALAGFATGLLGVGGGFILAPLQFYLLISIGTDPDTAIRTAFGTSLAVILPTAISGAYGHYSRHKVLIRPAFFLGISGFIGGLIGGYITTHISSDPLRILFGLLLIGVCIQLLIFKNPQKKEKRVENVLQFLLWGLAAGVISGLLGIGGGVILVPIMTIMLGFTMIEAVGTSTAVIILTSIGGILSYILNGLNVSGLPPYSLGYINLLQLVLLAVTSISMAQVGVRAAHRLSDNKLRYIFVILLLYIAMKMLGVFKWLQLPL